jgi:transposase
MKEITTVGVDLAKSVFTVHGVDAAGRTVLRKTVRREKLMELMVALPPCLIGMEACGGAHDLSHPIARVLRTTATTRKRSARRWRDRTCVSCR